MAIWILVAHLYKSSNKYFILMSRMGRFLKMVRFTNKKLAFNLNNCTSGRCNSFYIFKKGMLRACISTCGKWIMMYCNRDVAIVTIECSMRSPLYNKGTATVVSKAIYKYMLNFMHIVVFRSIPFKRLPTWQTITL